MIVRWFRYPILFILLWNFVPGVGQMSPERPHLEKSHQQEHSQASGVQDHEHQGHQEEVPCNTDCHDETCADHHCHFGHCRALSVLALGFWVPQGSEAFFARVPETSPKDIISSPFRPPAPIPSA